MTLKNNRAPLLSNIKLYASFHHHMCIQTGVTVRKRSSWVVTSVTLTFDLWPWPFAWTLPWSVVITPENFMMIRWWEHSQKGVTDRQTDGQTDRQTENTIHRAAWSQLKKITTSESRNLAKWHFNKYYTCKWFHIYCTFENYNWSYRSQWINVEESFPIQGQCDKIQNCAMLFFMEILRSDIILFKWKNTITTDSDCLKM